MFPGSGVSAKGLGGESWVTCPLLAADPPSCARGPFEAHGWLHREAILLPFGVSVFQVSVPRCLWPVKLFRGAWSSVLWVVACDRQWAPASSAPGMWWLHAVASANESCRGSPFRSEWALSREAGKVPRANSCEKGLCRVHLPSCQLSP